MKFARAPPIRGRTYIHTFFLQLAPIAQPTNLQTMQPLSTSTDSPCAYIHRYYANLQTSTNPVYQPTQQTANGEIIVPTTHGKVAVSCRPSYPISNSHRVTLTALSNNHTADAATTQLRIHFQIIPPWLQLVAATISSNCFLLLPPFVWTSFVPDNAGKQWERNVTLWVPTCGTLALPRPRRVDEPMAMSDVANAAAASQTRTTHCKFIWDRDYKTFVSQHFAGMLPPFEQP